MIIKGHAIGLSDLLFPNISFDVIPVVNCTGSLQQLRPNTRIVVGVVERRGRAWLRSAWEAGTLLGGLVLLIATYFMRLQRQYEEQLRMISLGDVVAHWSSPTPEMSHAVQLVQMHFRYTPPLST